MAADRRAAAVVRQLWPLLNVRDIARSVAFYRDLGFALVRHADNEKGGMYWCRIERGGASIMLQQGDAAETADPHRGRGVTFYFLCDDVDLLHAELSSRGLRLQPPKVAYYGMKQLHVPEPDGYQIWFESEATAPGGSA